jgi:hypothetical protein
MAAGEDPTKAIVRDLFVLEVSNEMADRCS